MCAAAGGDGQDGELEAAGAGAGPRGGTLPLLAQPCCPHFELTAAVQRYPMVRLNVQAEDVVFALRDSRVGACLQQQ